KYAWEFLVDEMRIPKDKLLIAVFEKDDEAFGIWEKQIGVPKEKIYRLDEENNFWAVGPTGPCGPCSEIYFDLGARRGCGKPDCAPGCDCDRFLEVWNLVFIQYNRDSAGKLIPLKSKGIDTGMGLERIASILQGVETNFDTDLFVPLIEQIKKLSGQAGVAQRSWRIIADHVRAVTHLISDGVTPGNTGRAYVLRRLIRRAVRHGRLLGISKPFLALLAQEVINQMKEAYPLLGQKDKIILEIVKIEERNFLATLEQGMSLFDEVMKKHQADKLIPGGAIFKLHDTYGFPIELSKEIAAEAGYNIDEKAFEAEMEKQKDRAREAGIPAQKKQRLAALNLSRFEASKFEGYKKDALETKIKAVFAEQKFVILDKTPFYAESGGQVGDTGVISTKEKNVRVLDALITPEGTILHEIDDPAGLKEGLKVQTAIDAERRRATEKHHTATHLLHKALREVLGEQVKQAGSYVGPDKLRFDFSHFAAMTPEEIGQVEKIVNQKIREKLKVEVLNKSYGDAVKMGAMALFGEKYGDKVRVLKIADYSLELCGGTHVKSTGDILFFKIMSETSPGAGLRRIEAVAGQQAKLQIVSWARAMHDEVAQSIKKYRKLQNEIERLGGNKFTETGIFEIEITELDSLSQAIDNQDSERVGKFSEHLTGRTDWLRERVAKAEKEIINLKLKSTSSDASQYAAEMIEVKGVKVLLKDFQDLNMQMLRTISDTVRNKVKSCIVVLVSAVSGRLIFLITVTSDLVGQGYSANKIAGVFAPLIGGKGGGKDEKVEGGGKDASKITEAFEAVKGLLSA
ncbi:alanine--tRNA ligase, partial [Candidatus Margulisiibacteriota bacterium]